MKFLKVSVIASFLFLGTLPLYANGTTSDITLNPPKRSVASDREADINTPYTPAYLEKIDAGDHESDPAEYVEDTKANRSRRD